MKYLKTCLSILLFFGLYNVAFALPTITSFSSSVASAISGQLISLSWAGQDVSGYNLLVECQLGVKIKNQDNSIFPCGTKVATSNLATDISFYPVNISGSDKIVTFRLYPKSTAGDEYTSGVISQTFTLSSTNIPISSFTASSASTTSGGTITLSWISSDLDGVNIYTPCVDGVTATSSVDGISMPCGKLAFDNKLAGSGSIILSFKNTNLDITPVTVRVLPYIGNGMYDGVHFQSVNIEVASDKVLPSQILTFVPSKPIIASDDNVDISWSSKYTNGVNLKMECNEFLTGSVVMSSGNQIIKCNQLIFYNAVDANSSKTFTFYNSSNNIQYLKLFLLPQFSYGGYDGINTKTISITILPKGQSVITTQNTGLYASSSGAVSQKISTTSQIKQVSPRKKFLKSMSLGSKGDDVSALQEYLAKSGYYPEGTVTGYFGKLTQNAIQRFQEDKKIAKKGVAGYGNVGPATRAQLNSL